MDDVNIIEIDSANLTLASLKAAIATAGATTKDDLIVVRTTASTTTGEGDQAVTDDSGNTIRYTSQEDEIIIDIDSPQFGSVSIVSLGTDSEGNDLPLTLDANQKSRVMTVSGTNTKVYLGGLTVTGGNSSSSAANTSSGGGIYNYSGTLTVTNSTISGNTASSSGGGIYSYGTLTVTNSTISGNTASDYGGGIVNSGTLMITNSTISGNTASDYVGGIYNYGTLMITNSTISGNTASSYVGGIYSEYSGMLTITNSIISQNYASEGWSNVSGTISDGGNNMIGYVPGFVEAPVFDTDGTLTNVQTLDLHLRSYSPAIDAGNNTVVTENSTDLEGNLRIYHETVDIGAYEYQGDRNDESPFYSSVVNTLSDSFDLDDGEWSLREAICYMPEYATITFAEELTGTILLTRGELVIDRALAIDGGGRITIDADQKSRGIMVGTDTVDAPVILNGLTIQNGNTDYSGGGIFNSGTLTITNSTISGNTASSGGGIFNYGTLTVTNSTISGNTASDFGGGIYSEGTLTVTNSTVSGNTASYYGGGIYNSGTLMITNSTISGNTASSSGGGIYSYGTLTVTNSTISGNTASDYGGGIVNSGTLMITNSTISGNTASDYVGGIYNYGTLMITNSTISGNTASSYVGGIYSEYSGMLTITNSIISQNYASEGWSNVSGTISDGGNNMIGYVPGFVEAPVFDTDGTLTNVQTLDLHLRSYSPAIDAGNNTVVTENSTDLEGNLRIYHETVDIGAYEYQGDRNDESPFYSSVVNTLSDSFDLDDGEWSLREAICYMPEYATITFAEELTGTILLTRGELVIDRALAIDGGGRITIDADQKSRGIMVGTDTVDAPVILNGLTIQNGNTDYSGGGIFNSGTLTITNSTISGNTASSGGGIFNDGTLTVTNSTVSGNTASENGGGIYNDYSQTLTVTNSTISENTASFRGGGICNYSCTLTVTNSTVSGNTASENGGGIYSKGTVNVYNTIIACNTAVNGMDVYKGFETINGYNSLSSYTDWGGSGNIVYDPNSPLFRSVENGDYRLVPGSQASEKGNNQYAYNAGIAESWFDLAGEPRFIGENIDIGAYESTGFTISQNSVFVGNVSLQWEQYKNTDRVRLTWFGGISTEVLGIFESVDGYVWDTTQFTDAYGNLKVEYLDENDTVILTSTFSGLILNDANTIVHRGRMTESETWAADKVHLVVGQFHIQPGTVLTIDQDAIVKYWKNAYLYNGIGASLTIGANAIFTRAEDDTVGGDTNKDGGLFVPKIGNSYVRGNGTFEMADSVTMKFITNTTSGAISTNETWYAGQVYHVTGTITVQSGATLTILPDAIVKFDKGCSLVVASDGNLVAEGSAAQPIVFTSVKDDSYGGDTNEDDGEYGPEAGDWNQIACNGGTIVLNHVIIQYCSSVNNEAGIFIDSGDVTFNNSRISFTMYDAMRNNGGNFYAYNSIFEESSVALSPRGGTTEIVNCVIANSTTAIRGIVGNLVNTVIYNITSVIFDWGVINCDHCVIYNPKGVGPQSASAVGSNGNIWANPLFRNAAAGDYHLMAGSPCIDAADGTAAPLSDITGAPRYSDLYTTPTGTVNADGEYADIGAYEFTDATSSSIDLEPVDIQVPTSVAVGETVTIQWTVRNGGTITANGTCVNQILLVSENGQIVNVCNVSQYVCIYANDLQTFKTQVIVPNVSEGNWHFVVNLNVNRTIFEGLQTDNNSIAATSPTQVLIPLTTERQIEFVLKKNSATLYRFSLPAGEAFSLTAVSDNPVDIYLQENYAPSHNSFDIKAVSDGQGNYSLFVPQGSEDRILYLEIEAGSRPANGHLKIENKALDILSTSVSDVTTAGSTTIGFLGAGFDSAMTVSLQNGSTVINGSVSVVSSGAYASASFDLTNVTPGSYDFVVKLSDNVARLQNAIVVVEAPHTTVNQLEAQLEIPSIVRPGRIYQGYVVYENNGSSDMLAPIFFVSSSTQTQIGISADSLSSDGIRIVGIGSEDTAGILRPGESFRIPFYFQANATTSIQLENMSYSQDQTYPNSSLFSSWTDYHQAIADAATRWNLRGEQVFSLESCYRLAYRLRANECVSAVSGVLRNQATGEAMSGYDLVLWWYDSEGEYQSAWGKTNEMGHFIINELPSDVDLTFGLLQGVNLQAPIIHLTGNQDFTNVFLKADSGALISGVVTNATGTPENNAIITIYSGVELIAKTTTDENGCYSISGLDSGTYQLWGISSDDSAYSFVEFMVESQNVTGVNVALVSDGTSPPTGALRDDLVNSTNIQQTSGLSKSGFQSSITMNYSKGMALQALITAEGKWTARYYPPRYNNKTRYNQGENSETLSSNAYVSLYNSIGEVFYYYNVDKDLTENLFGHIVPEYDGSRILHDISDGQTIAYSGENFSLAYFKNGVPISPLTFFSKESSTLDISQIPQSLVCLLDGAIPNAVSSGKRISSRYVILPSLLISAPKLDLAQVTVQLLDSRDNVFYTYSPIDLNSIQGINSIGSLFNLKGMNLDLSTSESSTWLMTSGILSLPLDAGNTLKFAIKASTFLGISSTMFITIGASGNVIDGDDGAKNASRTNIDSKNSNIAKSYDPNEINGPVGYDFVTVNTGTEDEPFLVITTPNWIADDTDKDQAFKIYFENKSTATASAQEIFVTTTLPDAFNWESFELSEICIGNQIFDVMAGYADGVWTVSQTSTGDQIQISANVDNETGIVNWYLRSYVTSTADHFPTSAYDGFLPPNNKDTHDGEGYVSFTVRLDDELTTNTKIEYYASIIFDTNEPIVTNTWLNTIDAEDPTSEIVNVVYVYDTNSITVEWEGSDVGSGIAGYDVYYSTDGGTSYTKWLSQTTDISATLLNIDDYSYSFMVVAFDNVGRSNSGVTANLTVNTDKPIVLLPSGEFLVQEGCSLHLSAGGSKGDGLTYLWNLNPEDYPDRYSDQYGESFWISTRQLGSEAGTYTIGLKVRDARGVESLPVSATITVVEVPPCITVDKYELADGQMLKLNLSALYCGRFARQWTINWGDESDPSVYDICTSHLSSAHYYGNTPGNYNITLSLVDSNGKGGDITYYIGTHTVNGTRSGSSENDPAENNSTEQPVISDTEGDHQIIAVTTDTWYDAEKTEASSSSNLCWAGSASNILYYTGWASGEMTDADLYSYTFESEDDVMNYFVNHFTNGSGNVYYAVDWFLTGNNAIPTTSPWAQNDVHGGGFHSGMDINNIRQYYNYNDSDAPETILPEVAELLVDGYGIGISLGAYSSAPNGTLLNGHAVTLWGYTADPTCATTDPEYFTSLKISDSDDDKYLGKNAPDNLMTVDIQWNTDYQKYQVLNYGSTGRTYWVEEFVAIAPKTEELLLNKTMSSASTVTDPILAAALLLDHKSDSESLGSEMPLRSATIDSQTNVSSKESQYQPMAATGLNPAAARARALESLWDDDFDLLGESNASSWRQTMLKTSLESKVFAQDDLDDLFTPCWE